MNKNSKIGIFDSGIGGITVLKEILKILPSEDYIYYSDSINNPYGDKNPKEIIDICDNIVKYLLSKECKIIVIACNTATAIAIDYLRKKYPKEKFIGIEPAYKMVHCNNSEKSTLVMATNVTIKSEKFNTLYSEYNDNNTYLLPCIGLAQIIENESEESLIMYLNKILKPYIGKVKNVVLGCTHYPLIKNEIRDILGNVNFFSGSTGLSVHLKEVLEKENLLNDIGTSSVEFIDSSNSKIKEQRFYTILENKG